MAGESINAIGSYATVQAASSTADTVRCAGAVTDITAALGATESKYPLLDFKVIVSAGTPLAGSTIDIYKRNGGDQPIPSATYKQTYVGGAKLDVATGNYYRRGVVNDDPSDTYYMINSAGATVTIALEARGRGYNVAA